MRFSEIKESAYQVLIKDSSVDDLEKQLGEYYPIVLEYIKNDKFIYRGMKGTGDIILGDGKLLTRASANTTNIYTLLMDILPSWRGWPKRSKSFICSSSTPGATGYGNLYIVIPLDGQPIGKTISGDFWDAFNKELEKLGTYDLPYFNFNLNLLSAEIMPTNISKVFTSSEMKDYIKEFDTRIKETEKSPLNSINKFFDYFKKHGLIKGLNTVLDPKLNGNTLYSSLNEYEFGDKTREVWLSGKVLFIRYNVFQSIRDSQ